MITKELVDYIKAQRASGKDDGIIRQLLLNGGGWEHGDVDEALAIAGPNVFAIPKPPAPPQPPRPTTPVVSVMPSAAPAPSAPVASFVTNPAPTPTPAAAAQPISAPAFTPAPTFVAAPIQTPSNQSPSMPLSMPGQFTPRSNVMPVQAFASAQSFAQSGSGQIAPKSSRKNLLIFTFIGVLLVCAGAYAYLEGYFSMDAVTDINVVSDTLPLQESFNENVSLSEITQNATTSAEVIGVSENNLASSTFKTYTDKSGRFEFSYPEDASISEISGNIATTISIERNSYNLYFLFQGRADDYSSYTVHSTKRITIGDLEAVERIVTVGPDETVSLQIEIKRYKATDGLERADSFSANFDSIDEANAAAKEIEDIAKTLKYL